MLINGILFDSEARRRHFLFRCGETNASDRIVNHRAILLINQPVVAMQKTILSSLDICSDTFGNKIIIIIDQEEHLATDLGTITTVYHI